MPVFEVWEYGHGDAVRLRFTATHEEDAAQAFLDRRVATGRTYRETKRRAGHEKLLLCVKDPTVTGTREDPNYPSIHHIPLTEEPR